MSDQQEVLELPDYHGQNPVRMKSAVNGAGNRILRPHAIGGTHGAARRGQVPQVGA
jgi:hypothetical protein